MRRSMHYWPMIQLNSMKRNLINQKTWSFNFEYNILKKLQILEKILINFKKKAIGEETDLIEYLNTLKKEFKKKFLEFKIKNEEKIQV